VRAAWKIAGSHASALRGESESARGDCIYKSIKRYVMGMLKLRWIMRATCQT
jgi:hypothetical protein